MQTWLTLVGYVTVALSVSKTCLIATSFSDAVTAGDVGKSAAAMKVMGVELVATSRNLSIVVCVLILVAEVWVTPANAAAFMRCLYSRCKFL
jgi:hypothetical protein